MKEERRTERGEEEQEEQEKEHIWFRNPKPHVKPTSSLCSVARAARDVTDCPVSPFFLVFAHLLSWWHEALLQFFVFFPPRYEKGRVFFPLCLALWAQKTRLK